MDEVILVGMIMEGVDKDICIYDKPIKMAKFVSVDGVFLVDVLLGTLGGIFAKEEAPGVWRSIRLPKHLMFEKQGEEAIKEALEC